MTTTRSEFTDLLNVYLPIAVAVFAIVVLALTFVVVRFRHRPGGTISQRKDAPRAEAAYALTLAAIVVVLVVVTFRGESHVDALTAPPALRVSVTGSDWRWRFDYPKQGITEVGHGKTPSELFVPAGQTIEFNLSSLDVIHAFYIPYERFQRAAIPKIINRFDLVFPKPGVVLSGSCNEFCGLGHTQMRFEVHVLTPRAFAAWVTGRQQRERKT